MPIHFIHNLPSRVKHADIRCDIQGGNSFKRIYVYGSFCIAITAGV
jgi:hypothetical protein